MELVFDASFGSFGGSRGGEDGEGDDDGNAGDGNDGDGGGGGGADGGGAGAGGGAGGGKAALAPPSRPFTQCGQTGRYLQLLTRGPQRLVNPVTQQVWQLPQGGAVKPYLGLRCSLCDFELALFAPRGGGPDRHYPLCPHCYSRPPDGGEAPAADALCSGCPHPVDHPAVAALAVCACPETADRGGWLLLDPTGGPRWHLVSSRGRYTMPFPPFVHKLSVGAGCGCAGGSCRLLRVEFHRERSPLADGATVHEGCVLTDPLIADLCDAAGGGGGKGKGKGGSKGKGKGKGKGDDKGKGAGDKGKGGGKGKGAKGSRDGGKGKGRGGGGAEGGTFDARDLELD